MSRFNASIEFMRKRKLTRPVVDIPRNVKEFLNIDMLDPKGVFKIEPGYGVCMYDQCYMFEDINYVNKDTGQKTSTLLEINRLFRSVDNQIKWTIASEQRDMDVFMKDVFNPIHGDEYPDIKDGVGTWINQKIYEGPRNIERIMYLTVTCYTYSFEEAIQYFSTVDTVLQSIFEALDSRLYKMSAVERLAVLQRMLRLGAPGIPPRHINTARDDWKNQILPARIRPEEDGIVINQKYACVLFGGDYDSSVDEEKLVYSLTSHGKFPTYVTVDFEVVKRRLVRDKLMATHANNERSIEMEKIGRSKQKTPVSAEPSYERKKQKAELEDMIEQLDENDEEGLFAGLLVMVYADDLEELQNRIDTICGIANSNYFTLMPYYDQQLQALSTILPIGGRRVDCMRFLFASSAVAFQPFHAATLYHPDGSVVGLNQTTNELIRVNRKLLAAPHGIVVAHTGAGKSYFVNNIEVAQTLLFTDDNITIIDPNNERQEFVEEHGGDYYDLTPSSGIRHNPYEVPRLVWDGDAIVKDRFVAKQTEFSGRFFAASMENSQVSRVTLAYVEEATQKIYKEYFAAGKFEEQPTLTKIWDELKKQEEKATNQMEKRTLYEITKCSEAYVHGVYDMFAYQSNLNITNRLVGFGLKNIQGTPKKVILLTMMHVIGQRIENNQGELIAERLIVDEAQALCEDEFISGEFLYAIETYRKVGAIVTIIVQNLKYVLDNNDLCNMFSNCPYKVFFDQGGVDAAELAKIQELSKMEMAALNEKRPGCGILVCEGKVYMFDNRMAKDNVLYSQFNTNFHEKAAQKVGVE
ncbi:MAG: VirB4-like conjugal transfer ATPase, CD1110 family [Agathobacter sp.]